MPGDAFASGGHVVTGDHPSVLAHRHVRCARAGGASLCTVENSNGPKIAAVVFLVLLAAGFVLELWWVVLPALLLLLATLGMMLFA